MNHSKSFGKGVLSAAALFLLAGPASAAQGDWTEVQDEIESCVTVVGEHADYSDAVRVRHEVTRIKARTVGYKLAIATSVFTENGETAVREYATSCVVNGNNVPMLFEISETDNDA
jgi:hypothetical protein